MVKMPGYIISVDGQKIRARSDDRQDINRLTALAEAKNRSQRNRLRRAEDGLVEHDSIRRCRSVRVQNRLPQTARAAIIRVGHHESCRRRINGGGDEEQQAGEEGWCGLRNFHSLVPVWLFAYQPKAESAGNPANYFSRLVRKGHNGRQIRGLKVTSAALDQTCVPRDQKRSSLIVDR